MTSMSKLGRLLRRALPSLIAISIGLGLYEAWYRHYDQAILDDVLACIFLLFQIQGILRDVLIRLDLAQSLHEVLEKLEKLDPRL
jgi:hypothetical protein